MRIKKWLLLSYFIVMILPLIAAYFLFAWISSHDDDQKVAEYLHTSIELQEIKSVLNDPLLYKPKADREKVEQLADQKRSIVLYNPNGLVYYTSNPALTSAQFGLSKDQLYQGLYSLEQGYRTYTYKQPVFEGNDLVGFFQVKLAREEWVTAVLDRSYLMLGIFVVLFIIIYLVVIQMVNRKLNKRLTDLMDEMTAFANGQVIEETQTNSDEIGKLKERFYEMRRQINVARDVIEQEQSKKEFMIASISHDLKTPLTSIKTYAEALENERGLTANEQVEYRKVIMDKSDFMKQMLDDLLTYTLLQSPSYEMEFVQVDGNEFFDMLISDYEALCREKNIELSLRSNVAGSYEVNPKQMMRVADNLMSNAIQHTTFGGKIWLAAISEAEINPWLFNFVRKEYTLNFNENVYFIVQNEGKGIARDKIGKIFDPNYQVDQSRSKKDDHGTGLGLSITKQIIEKHGGRVLVFSAEGVGTCVISSLPKVRRGGNELE